MFSHVPARTRVTGISAPTSADRSATIDLTTRPVRKSSSPATDAGVHHGPIVPDHQSAPSCQAAGPSIRNSGAEYWPLDSTLIDDTFHPSQGQHFQPINTTIALRSEPLQNNGPASIGQSHDQ